MSFAKDILLRNWGVKLTSILLAFLLWLAVRGEPSAEVVVTVPLEIILPADMQITSERPSTVEVTLRGMASNMWFGQPLPSCRVDLGQAGEGEREVPLMLADVRVPRATGVPGRTACARTTPNSASASVAPAQRRASLGPWHPSRSTA